MIIQNKHIYIQKFDINYLVGAVPVSGTIEEARTASRKAIPGEQEKEKYNHKHDTAQNDEDR